jgi:hypothetical protein
MILVLQALFSLHAWFLWGVPDMLMLLFLFVVSFCFFVIAPFWLMSNGRIVVAFSILIFELYLFRGGNFNGYLYGFFNAFALIPIVLLKPHYQSDLLIFFQKVLAVILAVSLFFWILHLIGVPLPSSDLVFGERAGDDSSAAYYFDNYYVFLVNTSFSSLMEDFLARVRFSSVFLEPGYLAVLMVFHLFINGFDLKEKRNIIFILTLIATISLAGFLMGIFAYIANGYQKKRKSAGRLVVLGLIILTGFQFFSRYNGGDNIVNHGIIERLVYDEQNNTISGNNRTSEELDNQYNRFLTSSDVFFGIGREGQLEMGVGYKAFVVRHGVFGLMLFLFMLVGMVNLNKCYRSWILLVLYVLMFARGHAVIMYAGFVLTYVCGIIASNIKNTNKINEKDSNHIAIQGI